MKTKSICRLLKKRVGTVSTNTCGTCSREDLQTFLIETIPHCVFDEEEKVGKCPILKNCLITLTKAATGGVL